MSKRVLVVDNYDSFTYNLVQYLRDWGAQVDVHLNDRVSVEQIRGQHPDGILLSPGPGTPNDAGITLQVLAALGDTCPIFGVCLGHQSIGQHFGGRVVRAQRLMHGKTSIIKHDTRHIYANMPNPFVATRYHSLIVEEATLPDCLVITARSEQGELMGLRHVTLPIQGVQFHPESFLTQAGPTLVGNWLESL